MGRTTKLRLALLMAVTLTLVVWIQPSAAQQALFLCVKQGGELYVIKLPGLAQRCEPGERAIRLSTVGQRGPRGPRGPPGPRGEQSLGLLEG